MYMYMYMYMRLYIFMGLKLSYEKYIQMKKNIRISNESYFTF